MEGIAGFKVFFVAKVTGVGGMECNRLKNLIKEWYLQVKEEAMAPARMVTFMQQHVADCEVCLADANVKHELEKISALVLPPPKEPKVLRARENKEAKADVGAADKIASGQDEEVDGAAALSSDKTADEDHKKNVEGG